MVLPLSEEKDYKVMMINDDFSIATRNLLEQAGWNEKYSRNISDDVNILMKEGFAVSKAAEIFLSKFGGLVIKLPQGVGAYAFDFCAGEAAESLDSNWVNFEYAPRIGCVITPVGQFYGAHLIILLDEKGRFYLAFDENLTLVAESNVDAIELFCKGNLRIGRAVDNPGIWRKLINS